MSRLGQLIAGRIPLSEPYSINYQVNATTGEQTIALSNTEAGPPSEAFRMLAEDVMAILGTDIPVTFTQKTNHDGLYRVTDAGAPITEFAGHAYGFAWSLSLQRIGPANAVDIESRFTSMVRANSFALPGVRWHAPAIGSYGYTLQGGTESGNMTRAVEGDSPITIHLGIPVASHPQWGTTALNMRRGRVALRVSGTERTGIGTRITDPMSWTLSNGLIRITPQPFASGNLKLESWNGTTWDSQALDILTAGNDSDWLSVAVLRNDMETVTIRLVRGISSFGRALCDLTLRRGSRTVEGFIQSDVSGTIEVKTLGVVATTNNAASGYIVASGDDAAGNRFTSGCPITFTGSTTGSISKAAATVFPWYAGHVIVGAAPATGDAATDLRNQYIAAPAETDVAVKR